jgi:formylglycine-generating enzyme required for sulfatase activity
MNTETLQKCPITGMQLKLIPASTFKMGVLDLWANGGRGEQRFHTVTISSFRIGIFPVTQTQWQKIMGKNPSHFKGADHPVDNVSWEDCQLFINKLNEMSGHKYRLPTEAEWEFTCNFNNDIKGNRLIDENFSLSDYAWGDENSDNRTHVVGKKHPNNFGLFDMLGNVWEWCQDNYDQEYYGEDGSSFRMWRGGCWATPLEFMSPLDRGFSTPENRDFKMGFRLVGSI